MATSYAYPYQVRPVAMHAEVVSTSQDVPRNGRRFDLTSLTEECGQRFEITIGCRFDPAAIRGVLPEGEDAGSVRLGIREMSIGSHTRELHTGPEGELQATIPIGIDIDLRWGTIELTPVLVLASDIAPQTGFARAKGSVLSWDEAFHLTLDSTDPPPGGSVLEVEWRDFSADPDLPSGGLYTLEVEDNPRLLLNSASPEAYDVLRSEATTGTKARLRDLTFMSIALDVWANLIRSAYDNLRSEARLDQSATPEEILVGVDGWQHDVLEAWAPRLVSESDPESALTDLAALAKSGDSDPLAALDRVLQAELGTRSAFDHLAKDALGD